MHTFDSQRCNALVDSIESVFWGSDISEGAKRFSKRTSFTYLNKFPTVFSGQIESSY